MTDVKTDDQLFSRPSPVSGVEVVFGGDIRKLMPSYEALPDDFQRARNPFCKLVSQWFFRGLDTENLKVREGIDKNAALLHCKAVMVSFEPSHEHKIAGVAWLMSQWFKEPEHVQ